MEGYNFWLVYTASFVIQRLLGQTMNVQIFVVFFEAVDMNWFVKLTFESWKIIRVNVYIYIFNPLALELEIYSLAHHLCKMLLFYEPRRVTLGNTRHFVEE